MLLPSELAFVPDAATVLSSPGCFNAHTVEYADFAPLRCPCYTCIEERYVRAVRARARPRDDA